MNAACPKSNAPAIRQRGVAAIEFALVVMVLFLFLYGVVTFGAVLYTQQAVSRAAEDGARAVSQLPTALTANDPRIKDIKSAVYDSLASALIVPLAGAANPRNWIATHVQEPLVELNGNSVLITVTYPYNDATRLLPLFPMLGTDLWVPKVLASRAAAVGQL